MKKLNRPSYGSVELFDKSVDGIHDLTLRQLFIDNRPNMVVANTAYDYEAHTQTWCNLPRAAHGNPDAVVVGTLSKRQLTGLYSDHVVRSKEGARGIYDDILVKAHGKCPYCGGIGEAKTLDHYLPKARFPSYSVLPVNLVPACRDCNTGMGSSFPTDPSLQPVHPYLDAAHFFDEKWTTAIVLQEDPIVVNFGVSPPAHWSARDQSRVAQHFQDCDLGERYRLQVWDELAPLISQRKDTLKELDTNNFRAHLLVTANESALPINGWKRTLYDALAATGWFCMADFTAPNGHMPAP